MPLASWGWKTLWKCGILLCSCGISAAREGMFCLPVTHAYMMHPPALSTASQVCFVLFFSPKSRWTVLALIRLKHSSLDLPPFADKGLPRSLPAGLATFTSLLPGISETLCRGPPASLSIYQMKAHYSSNRLWPMGFLLVVHEEGIVTYCLFPAAQFH